MTTATTNEKPRRRIPPASRAQLVTKKVQIIKLLRCSAGANIATICAKLGWQAQTVRAALTGLRKAGHEVTCEKPGPGKPTRYRIVGSPVATASADTVATEPLETTDAG